MTEPDKPTRRHESLPELIAEASAANGAFSRILPGLQLYWDSTSLGEFKACPRRYLYSILLGYRERRENVHFRFGIDYHATLELYDHRRADNSNHREATLDAVRHALEATWDTETNRPWNSGDDYKNRDTLIRSIVGYLDHFSYDSVETVILANGKAAVELSFRFEIPWRKPPTEANGESDSEGKIAGERYYLCGHIDRLVIFQGDTYVLDRKTTKSKLNSAYFAKYSPDNQVSLYSLAGKWVFGQETKGMIIDAAQILVTETRFQRRMISRTESQLQEWVNDADYYITLAEIAATNQYWPQNDKSCGLVYEDPATGSIRYGCPFRPVCGSAPEIRQTLLDLNYDRRIWDPTQTREKGSKTDVSKTDSE